MKKQPKIITIVLTWNSEAFIEECLISLKGSRYKTEILVVDNNSSDNTREFIKDNFPDIELINSGANLGYAGGNNFGIRHAVKKKPDYIFILNPDASVAPNCLSLMVAHIEQDKKMILASPMIYYHNSRKISYAGSYINWRSGDAPHIGQDELDTGQFDAVKTTERANGCAMLLRCNNMEAFEYMDERYFLYYEELDLCVRLVEAGYKIGFVPKAKVWHLKSSSTGGYYSPLSQYYQTRNRLLFMHKFRPRYKTFIIESLFLSSIRVLQITKAYSLRKGWASTKVIFKAHRDYFKERFGQQKF